MSGLIYVGNGDWLPEVPARDLTEDEVKQYGGEKVLLATRLYEKPKRAKSSDKEEEGE